MAEQQDGIVIIGGGVIGVCSAYFLARAGHTVTLLDKGSIGGGCSYGNAGLIVPGHLIPLAAPGAWRQGLKWLLDADGPFYIKPRPSRALLAWLWRFLIASRDGPARRAMPLLRDLGQASVDLFDKLVDEEELVCHYQQAGLLTVYRSRHGYQEGEQEARLLQAYGATLELLPGDAAREVEPALHPQVAGAVFHKRDGRLNPALFVAELAQRARAHGANLQDNTEVLGLATTGSRLTTVRTTRGDFWPRQVILAAGSWSPAVADGLGLSLPVQAAKGYSITIERPAAAPRLPLLLAETRVAVTPMGERLRYAGTLELAGMDLSINQRRVEAILRAPPDYLVPLEPTPMVEIWRGLRPTTPDGLPLLGRSRRYDNLIIATGHATTGISLGPITGRLVAQLAAGERPDIDLTLLQPERFA